MVGYMGYDWHRGTKLFLNAILNSLQQRADYIRAIERNGRGEMPIDGIAFDVHPDYGYVALSLRESKGLSLSWNSADWPHFEFVNSQQHKYDPLMEAVSHMRACYEPYAQSTTYHGVEIRHLMMVSAAFALIDPAVADLLRSFEIEAATWDGRMYPDPRYFEYVVLNAMESDRLNYCELMRQNLITTRLMGAAWDAQKAAESGTPSPPERS